MKSTLLFVVAISLAFAGCRAAYHVVTAPARVFHHSHDEAATSDDIVNPGRPITPASPTPRPPHKITAQSSPKPSALPRIDRAPIIFPTAKRVPDKPGYVFSPSDATKYVDVSGYPSGSKVKDPYSGKIFLVP